MVLPLSTLALELLLTLLASHSLLYSFYSILLSQTLSRLLGNESTDAGYENRVFVMHRSEARKSIYRGGGGRVGAQGGGAATHVLAPLPLKICGSNFASLLSVDSR